MILLDMLKVGGSAVSSQWFSVVGCTGGAVCGIMTELGRVLLVAPATDLWVKQITQKFKYVKGLASRHGKKGASEMLCFL